MLALEFALRHPAHASHLVLINPAPVPARDFVARLRARRTQAETRRTGGPTARDHGHSAAYQDGEPGGQSCFAARYRIHSRAGAATSRRLREADDDDASAARQSGKKAGIIKARAIERSAHARHSADGGLRSAAEAAHLCPWVPTLVITGDHDFIPVDVSEHIARALPNARLVTIKDCGHFTYLECPSEVRRSVDEFFSISGWQMSVTGFTADVSRRPLLAAIRN